MPQLTQADFAAFKAEAESRGIFLPSSVTKFAMDADVQPGMPPNGGIPAIVSSFIDPEIVRTIFAKQKAVDILGEKKKGAWAQDTLMIQRVEQSGHVVAYDDYSEQGGNQVTPGWEDRQVYRYQTMVTYGELEQERYGLAMLPYVAEKQRAAAWTLNQAQNKFYFYGVSGLRNYGILNDPALPTPITPATVDGKTLWKDKQVVDIYNDILALYADLIARTNGAVGDGVDMASPLVLVMSPNASVWFKRANEIFGNTVEKMVKDTFTNLRIEVAPQYDTDAGELVQMFVETAQGQQAGYCAYSDKLRAHPIITMTSSWKQKHSGTTYGAVITQPFLFAQMLGV
ncbi:major capsid family protein [Yersinia enterocolitica]|uniref:major capsid family protein n=1 Tax=Yersinia enterocolitica TaxID=630 RepID=UPI000327E401|nr:major capsid family protein [Yersinia enterocolitica]CCV60766.1 putative phage protein [Yersinia enterocolitica (type O:2) str. YE3094/96]CNF44161.1 Uncharacterised protein [Yersinia enterocolitica]CNG38942.1 Uncharacterised protein [Yersinia enterocolitica]